MFPEPALGLKRSKNVVGGRSVNNENKQNTISDQTDNNDIRIPVEPVDAAPSTTETDPDISDPLETARKQADEYLETLQRLKAEFDNFRKRMAKEKQKLADVHQAVVLEAILPALDSFDAALKQPGRNESSDLYQGLKLIYDVLIRNLEKLDFHRLDVLNAPFDPENSEAIMVQPTDAVASNTVIGEISSGYRFRNSILRPARVVVSASPGDVSENPSEDSGSESSGKEDFS